MLCRNSEHIVGLKVRASHVITGSWGVTPVKLGKKIAKILKIPMMVHVGEPPASMTRCWKFSAPAISSRIASMARPAPRSWEDEDLFNLAERCASEGIRLDIGHGGASFSFKVAEAAIARGFLPFSISTDLHGHSMNFPVWDLATTMSKLLSVGMPFEKVVGAVTACARLGHQAVDGGPPEHRRPRRLHHLRLVDADLEATDSNGDVSRLTRLFEPGTR